MTKEISKAEMTRNIIRANIALVENGQDEDIIAMVEKQVGYAKKSDNKRAYFQQKAKVVASYHDQVATEAATPTLNKSGVERKKIEERKGKQTFANKVRTIIADTLMEKGDLGLACNEIESLVVQKYKEKGQVKKPSYLRLIARNELERVTPSIQASLGLPVSTPTELKLATRKRNWHRKVEA